MCERKEGAGRGAINFPEEMREGFPKSIHEKKYGWEGIVDATELRLKNIIEGMHNTGNSMMIFVINVD